ncbi:MAG: hypothetical protein ACI4OX_06350, partial [Akkermansia sp.]
MANWIKARHALVRSARVRRLCKYLSCKNHLAALGYALKWLCWVDEQTLDGHTHLTPEELDKEMGMRGGAQGLIEIGWAALDEEGCLVALEFDKHSGDTAKQRAEVARRKELCVARKKNAAGSQKPAAKGINKLLSKPVRKLKPAPETAPVDAPPPHEQQQEATLPTQMAGEHKQAAEDHAPAPVPAEPRTAATACPVGGVPTHDDVVRVMGGKSYPNVSKDELDRVAHKFLLTMQSRGWRDARGIHIHDWRAAAEHYLSTWSAFNSGAKQALEQRSKVDDERTALMKRDIESRIEERRHRMDPT